MHPNEVLISSFYEAFGKGDHETMGRSYRDDARFEDPVFPDLDASEVRSMWRMFCTSGNDIEVTYSNVRADDARGSAHWKATYRFPKTGRLVHNEIDASFEFKHGSIVSHTDRFDLYKWTRMALGPVGLLAGWTPLIQGQVRKQAASQLKRFRTQEA